MTGRFTRVLAGLLRRCARLLPAARRDWAQALLAEAAEVPAAASQAADDLDEVIDTLTTAFAQGRLTSQELGRRTDQALAARTLAELSSVTADLPARLTRTRPARPPARTGPRTPADQAVAWSAWGLITPALVAVVLVIGDPTPTDSKPIEAILSLVTLVYFVAWLVVGGQMLIAWHQQRRRSRTAAAATLG